MSNQARMGKRQTLPKESKLHRFFAELTEPEKAVLRMLLAAPSKTLFSKASIQQVDDSVVGRIASLSPREKEVFDMLINLQSTKDIAHNLNLSTKTIGIYRSNILSKMRAKNTLELVSIVLAERAR